MAMAADEKIVRLSNPPSLVQHRDQAPLRHADALRDGRALHRHEVRDGGEPVVLGERLVVGHPLCDDQGAPVQGFPQVARYRCEVHPDVTAPRGGHPGEPGEAGPPCLGEGRVVQDGSPLHGDGDPGAPPRAKIYCCLRVCQKQNRSEVRP